MVGGGEGVQQIGYKIRGMQDLTSPIGLERFQAWKYIFDWGRVALFFAVFDAGVREAIAGGKLAAKAVLGMPYKKDLKRVYKMHKQGIPVGANFFRDLLEIKVGPNSGRITKKLHSSCLGHLALSYLAKILAKSYRYAPSVFII
jgi:hypothetical protein